MLNFVLASPLSLARARVSRTSPACCAEAPSQYSAGDKVRVSASPLIFYHVSGAMNKPTDVSGASGTVLKVVDKVEGVPISATKPVVVKFTEPKFMGHFDDDELEAE